MVQPSTKNDRLNTQCMCGNLEALGFILIIKHHEFHEVTLCLLQALDS